MNKERTTLTLNDTLLQLQRLQYENDAGAAHDLLPLQSELHELLNHQTLQGGLVRRWIESDPDVAVLRNRADAWDPPPTADEVLQLMARRNDSAFQLGYADYPWAILSADGLSPRTLREHLNRLLSQDLDFAVSAAREAGIATMADWFSGLHRMGQLPEPLDPLPLLERFADALSLREVLSRTEVTIAEGAAFANRTGEHTFRMQVNPINTVNAWRTLFHEFGHVCTYALSPADRLPRLSAVTDEMIAVLFEHAAAHLLAEEPLRQRILQEMRMDHARCAVSSLFELDLWQCPARAESLYTQHYSRLVAAPDPAIWHQDSFRSIDCMTVPGYALGQLLATRLTPEALLTRLPHLCQSACDTSPQVLLQA